MRLLKLSHVLYPLIFGLRVYAALSDKLFEQLRQEALIMEMDICLVCGLICPLMTDPIGLSRVPEVIQTVRPQAENWRPVVHMGIVRSS